MDVGERAHEAILARDWGAARLLLHPYLHWTDPSGNVLRGRENVLAMLVAAGPPRRPAAVELRDGQVYRWIS